MFFAVHSVAQIVTVPYFVSNHSKNDNDRVFPWSSLGMSGIGRIGDSSSLLWMLGVCGFDVGRSTFVVRLYRSTLLTSQELPRSCWFSAAKNLGLIFPAESVAQTPELHKPPRLQPEDGQGQHRHNISCE